MRKSRSNIWHIISLSMVLALLGPMVTKSMHFLLVDHARVKQYDEHNAQLLEQQINCPFRFINFLSFVDSGEVSLPKAERLRFIVVNTAYKSFLPTPPCNPLNSRGPPTAFHAA